MANLTQSLSDSIRLLGPQASSKWGAMVWGTDLWGQSVNMPTDSVVIDAETLSGLSDTYALSFSNSGAESISLTFDSTSVETLKDQNGYSYVFVDNTTNVLNRKFTTFTTSVAPNTSWSESSTPTTNWT